MNDTAAKLKNVANLQGIDVSGRRGPGWGG